MLNYVSLSQQQHVSVGEIGTGAHSGSQCASTISGRSEPEQAGGLKPRVHPRLFRRLRFRYRWRRICLRCPFPGWDESHARRSHPPGEQTPLCCNEVGFSLRHHLCLRSIIVQEPGNARWAGRKPGPSGTAGRPLRGHSVRSVRRCGRLTMAGAPATCRDTCWQVHFDRTSSFVCP